MERWCETACAVASGGRNKPLPCEVATHAIHWADLVRNSPALRGQEQTSQTAVSAGDYDRVIRLYRGGHYVR